MSPLDILGSRTVSARVLRVYGNRVRLRARLGMKIEIFANYWAVGIVRTIIRRLSMRSEVDGGETTHSIQWATMDSEPRPRCGQRVQAKMAPPGMSPAACSAASIAMTAWVCSASSIPHLFAFTLSEGPNRPSRTSQSGRWWELYTGSASSGRVKQCLVDCSLPRSSSRKPACIRSKAPSRSCSKAVYRNSASRRK